jgi:hypothetical protein
MTILCPNGHSSGTADYCDQCGAPIPTVSAGEMTEILPVIDDADTSAATPQEPCPACKTGRHGDDRFCECCGYDFVTSAMPNDGGFEEGSAIAVPPSQQPVWVAIVHADRQQLARFGDEGLDFPEAWTGLTVVLVAPTVRIGRVREQSDPDEQEIDLSGPFADPGISRRHAMLKRMEDGSWEITDLGSTNGTWINAEEARLVGTRRLNDGDRIWIGAWTTIELRAREP